MDAESFEIHRRHDLSRIESIMRYQRVDRQHWWNEYIADCRSVGRDVIAREKIQACAREWSGAISHCERIIEEIRSKRDSVGR